MKIYKADYSRCINEKDVVFREIAFLRHVNRETAFQIFVVKREPYPHLSHPLNLDVYAVEYVRHKHSS
jgi:hypothetical protein